MWAPKISLEEIKGIVEESIKDLDARDFWMLTWIDKIGLNDNGTPYFKASVHRLADYLANNYDIQPNDIIGIMLDRSEMMIIAILGILKTGACYVCLDPENPAVRNEYIAKDTSLKLLLTQVEHVPDLKFYKGHILEIDKPLDSKNILESTKRAIRPNDLAYVMYTSGTTGMPKGVMVQHRNLTNLIYSQKIKLGISSNLKALQYASFAFDASVWEIFAFITSGVQLYIAPKIVRHDASLLCKYIQLHQIDIATLPPVLLSAMPYQELASLKTLIVAGETCASELMIKWSRGRRLINAYGPTESTVCATMHEFKDGDLNTNIGKPLHNTRVFVLDSNNIPVPAGVIGELHIGGACLARGYLNQPGQTNERFIANPFATALDVEKGYTHLYKTGDLARWSFDGDLNYVGRNDDQVKIRGHRIELGEIEHALLNIEGIQQTCVLVKKRETDGGETKYLVAYYILDSEEQTLTAAVIQNRLSQVLPDFMVPSAFVATKSFSKTINGKLDKNAFPDPYINIAFDSIVAPTTEAEIVICDVWQKVLGLDKIGILDDFFELGGDSILAIQASHRMSKELKCNVKVADIFRFKSVSDLAKNIAVKTIDSENSKFVF
jgi:amino acid adenylation domain-containing protein